LQISCKTEEQIPLDCEGGDCDFDCVTEDACWSGCDYDTRLQCRPTVNREGCVQYQQFREPCPSGYRCVPASHPGADAVCEPPADADSVEFNDTPVEMDIAEVEFPSDQVDDIDTSDQVEPEDSPESTDQVEDAEAESLEEDFEDPVELDSTDYETTDETDVVEEEVVTSFSIQAEDTIRVDLSSPGEEIIYLDTTDGDPPFQGQAVVLGATDSPGDASIQSGDSLVFVFYVQTPGSYTIAVEHPAALSCGQAKLYIDNQPLTGDSFDLEMYDTLDNVQAPFRHLGPTQIGSPVFLTAGEHELEMRVAGKTESATHYRIGADIFHFHIQ
jgi:hypothetical protein